MTSTHRALATSLALASALICAGCTQPSATPAESTTTTATSTPPLAKTTTPPALTPEQQDQKDAEQAVTNLIGVVNTVGTNPDETLDQLATVARGKSLDFWRDSRFRQRVLKRNQVGEMSVVTSPATVAADNTFQVPACLDVSQVDVVDENGKSIVLPDRVPKSAYTYTVDKTPDGFFVVDEVTTGSC